MEGLEKVARDSLTRMGGRFSDLLRDNPVENEEAAYAYFSDFLHFDEDERNWSISHLRRELRLKDPHGLFRRYQMRVQHALFVELLLLNLIVNIVLLSVNASEFLTHDHLTRMEMLPTSRICRAVSLVITCLLFVSALLREKWFNGSPMLRTGSAILTLATMVTASMGPTILHASHREEHQEVSSFYIVLTSAVLLPFSRKIHAAYAAVVIILIDLLLTYFTGQCPEHKSGLHLFRESFYLLMALSTGSCVRYFLEVMGRRAFLDRRECLESNMKSENEKDQEEKLLHSVLPVYVTREFREDFRSVVQKMVDCKMPLERQQPFNKLYVVRHTNVSILYADIVNSMLLCASLQAADLVDTLDDLFGRFDRVAEINNCMRIKLLGDCYYCVSGLPVPDRRKDSIGPNVHHADDCVRTGILMILIIKQVRQKRGINVDMRIGIHSGAILGGLLGLKKWQYDVWSRDVTIASHVEQSGFPGQVHITRDTFDLLVEDYGSILPGNGHLRDHFLSQEGIRTYLIAPRDFYIAGLTESEKEIVEFQRSSVLDTEDDWNLTDSLLSNSRLCENDQAMGLVPKRRRAVLDYSLLDYRSMIDKINNKMEVAIDRMELGKKDQWCFNVGVNPVFLTFQEWRVLEKRFLKQADPLFKNYLLCCLMLFLGIFLMQITTFKSNFKGNLAHRNETNFNSTVDDAWYYMLTWTTHGVTFIVLSIICLISWIGYFNVLKDEGALREVHLNQPYLLKISRQVWKKTSIRLFLWAFISVMIVACSLLGLHVSYISLDIPHDVPQTCGHHQWLHTACMTLALTASSVFIRIHYLLKLVLKIAGLSVFCTLRYIDDDRFSSEDAHHCFYLGMVVIILHFLDRQIEYVCRLDFVWRWKLNKEQEEVRKVELGNQILLNNILPKHVKQVYLDGKSLRREQTGYHEECSSVAVMFASIPNFSNFYCEDELNEAGRRCIQLLNEIVCDFDLLLLEKKYSRVEKIKTIGSTYMAACGLHKYNAESQTPTNSITEVEQIRRSQNVVTLARFARDMMAKLQQMNKDALQELQLRIGLAVGRVMAGVVGSMRPQFDIWGDAVNVASRMDSTGVAGRIQVTEEVADIIENSGTFELECRGQIFVKGKGELTTYFLKTCFDELNSEDTKL